MLKHGDNTEVVDAAQVRVSARDLTKALASLEVRKARQDYEQAGTVTLAEGIQGCSTEATPEELQAEVEIIRQADAVQERVKRQKRRLRLLIKAEIVSAVLSLLVLVSLQHTLFNRNWRQVRQSQDFEQKLHQSLGPNAKYQLSVVPESSRSSKGSQTVITTFGEWANYPAYPLYSLPEGYNIHHFDGLDDEGHNRQTAWFMPSSEAYFEFREQDTPFFRDNVTVYYEGLAYWRGRVRKQDVPSVLQGRAFVLYPALVASSAYFIPNTVPLTVSMRSIQEAQGQWGQASPQCYDLMHFADGKQLHLDSHAWESY